MVGNFYNKEIINKYIKIYQRDIIKQYIKLVKPWLYLKLKKRK